MVGMIYHSISSVIVSDTSYHKILFFHLVLYSEKQTEKLLSRRGTIHQIYREERRQAAARAAQNAPERRRELQENAESAECPKKPQGKERAKRAQKSHKETIPVYLVFERYRQCEQKPPN